MWEIPTIQSNLDALVKQIEKAPVEEILNKLLSAVEGIEGIVNSKEVKESLITLDQTLKDIHSLVQNVDSRVEPMISGIDATVEDIGNLARNIDIKIGPLISNIDATVGDIGNLAYGIDAKIDPLISSIENTVKALGATIEEDSPLIYQLNENTQGSIGCREFHPYIGRLS